MLPSSSLPSKGLGHSQRCLGVQLLPFSVSLNIHYIDISLSSFSRKQPLLICLLLHLFVPFVLVLSSPFTFMLCFIPSQGISVISFLFLCTDFFTFIFLSLKFCYFMFFRCQQVHVILKVTLDCCKPSKTQSCTYVPSRITVDGLINLVTHFIASCRAHQKFTCS